VGNLIIYFNKGPGFLQDLHTRTTYKDSCLPFGFFFCDIAPFGSFDTIWEFELVEKCGDKAKVYLMICNTQAARID
jgi:hypothetical protein